MYQRDRTEAEEDNASDGEEDEEETEGAAARPPAKKKKQREIDMLLQSDDEEEGREEGAKQEMENYLRDKSKVKKSPPKEKSGSNDGKPKSKEKSEPVGPLGWWKTNSDRYPKLALAAKYCLCIPATSTPSERIFSTAGYIVNKNRSCLLPENVDKLVFLAQNLKYD